MLLTLEWRIPWEAGWTPVKKVAAAEKLKAYMLEGTFFESSMRMKVSKVEVVTAPEREPYIKLTLER